MIPLRLTGVHGAYNVEKYKETIMNIEEIREKFNLKTLVGADLRGADLRGADLRKADLRGEGINVPDLPTQAEAREPGITKEELQALEKTVN
jgi:hypothetical protein